jgi:hypothetical protein
MAANEILQQATKLCVVSESLEAMAQENAPLADALSVLAKNIRESATLLEILVAVKLGSSGDIEKASN